MIESDSNIDSASRILPLRMRKDLLIVAEPSRCGTRWTIKDPVARRYWRLGEEASFLLESLNGRTTLDDLRAGYARRFSPRELTPTRLTEFLSNLHRQGLIVTEGAGESAAIMHRQRGERRAAARLALYRLLAWRFRGIDPDRWLDRTAPWLAWIFSAWFAVLWAIVLASAAGLTFIHWPALARELTGLPSAFTADQVLLIFAMIGVVKALHEIGHAAACKHFGGECHELGFMLFLGIPSLYCDVGDAWMLARKWPRVLIGAAGILTELGIAAACVWLWWLTYPGLIHSLALYALVVCSANTLLLNGNPLLQYDGYYVLSDLTDTPNLRAEASASIRRWLGRVLLGVPAEADHGVRRLWLPIYGAAAAVYRPAAVLGAVYVLHAVLEPYGVQLLAWVAGAVWIAALTIDTVTEIVSALRNPAWDQHVPWRWVVPRSGVAVMALLLLLFVPLPASVVAPAVLEPRNMRAVYIEVDGRLEWAVAAGTRVEKGEVIARLVNLPLMTELEKASGERDAAQLRFKNLRHRQADPAAAATIPTAEKSLADAEERLQQRRRDCDRLVICAPRSGVVLPRASRKPAAGPRLQHWIGTPLDPANLGCELCTGDVLCVIGEPSAMDAVLYISQGDEEAVQAGQHVELLADSFPDHRISGAVSMPPTTRAVEAPEELLAGGKLPLESHSPGDARPKHALFTARAQLASQEQPLLIGGTANGKVAVAPRSIAARVWRSLGQTFRDF